MNRQLFPPIACLAVLGLIIAFTGQAESNSSPAPPTLRELDLRIELLDGRVEDVEAQNEELKNRVKKLEKRENTKKLAQGGVRVMQLERMEQAPIDREKLGESQELMSKADAIFAEVKKIEDEILAKKEWFKDHWYWYYHNNPKDPRYKEARLQHKRWCNDKKDLSIKRNRGAKQLRGQARRLKKEAEAPRQLIYGWNGKVAVILETTKDLSRQLSEISKGDFLTWMGKRTDMTNNSERYEVKRIEMADKPADFTPR